MEAPDKIYTCYNIEEGEKRQLWSTVLLSDVEQVGEYIRKDVLLDKLLLAVKLRTDNAPEMLDSDGVQTIKSIISYIESL